MTTSTPLVLDADFVKDPYSFYRRRREEASVREVVMPRGLKVWMVTRYADVRDVPASPGDVNLIDAFAFPSGWGSTGHGLPGIQGVPVPLEQRRLRKGAVADPAPRREE